MLGAFHSATPYVEHRRISEDDFLRLTIMHRTIVTDHGCWEWQGADDKGYGMIMRDRKRLRVHRVSYELWCEPIPAGMVVRHQCDNPRCVNPGHLIHGTQAENMRDTAERGRHGGKKMTRKQVIMMRASKESDETFANEFGLGVLAIRRARRGVTWKHVPGNNEDGSLNYAG